MPIDLETRDRVAILTLNRPESLNAFDIAHLQQMIGVLSSVASDASVRALIVTGAGERAFSAGADIKQMARMTPAEGLEFGGLGHAVTRALERLPVPAIAAVNGLALGGGCEIAISCDLRVAAENAQFAQPEVTLGIPPGWGGTQRLPRLIGPGLAAEMIYAGRRVDANEASRIGLVNRVVPANELLTTAVEIASRIAANSPRAVRAAKNLVGLTFGLDFDTGLNAEATAFGAAFRSPDQAEGMTAFVEKRAASFADPE
jgi:enoyl-CoA hydratase